MPKKKAPTKKKIPPEVILNRADARDILMNMLLDAASETGGGGLDEAQDIMFEAWDTPQKRGRISLAKQALAISTDCADAYVLLGSEGAKSPEEAIAYFREGVKAGERALGKKAFKEDIGLFWGLIETRPYMRARHCLADALWEAGERDEALSHFQDMLRLNPNDNQGIRYILLTHLLFLGKDQETAALHKAYKDDGMADWSWSKVLLLFRTKGESSETCKALMEAVKSNKHVSTYLLGKKKLPKAMPPYMSPGDTTEAVAYVENALEAWRVAPGALEWVEKALSSKTAEPKTAKVKEKATPRTTSKK